MDFLIELLTGPIGIPLIMVVTIAAVTLFKRWTVRYEEAWWYNAAVITAAWVVGFGWSLAAEFANEEPLTWRLIVRLLFQGALIGMVSTGGYEWLKQVLNFIGGARESIRVGNIIESDGVAIGGDSSSEVDTK